MRKKVSWSAGIVLILSLLLFQGCAAEHPLNRDLVSLAPLMVRTCCVPYLGVRVYHDSGEITAVAMSAASPIIGGLIAAIGGTVTEYSVKAWEKTLEKEIISADVPRFYELVMEKFVEKASKEIPGWSPMVVEEQPVSPEFLKKFLKASQVLYCY